MKEHFLQKSFRLHTTALCHQRLLVVLLCMVVVTGTSSCILVDTSPIDRAVQAIDNGIKDIRGESSAWQTVLSRVAKDLPQEISAIIRTDAENLATRAIAATGEEFKCGVDFLANRAVSALEQLKAKLLNQTLSPLPPEFCQVIPSSIDLKVSPAQWPVITLHGYDLDHKDPAGNLFEIRLQDETGQVVATLPETRIGRTTHYKVTVNLGQMASTLYNSKIRKLLSFWGGSQMSAKGQVVIVAWEAGRKTEYVAPNATTYQPLYTKQPNHPIGDRDFDTDDDEPMTVDVTAEVTLYNNRLISRVYMKAYEPRDDWTAAEGWSAWATHYSPPAGWRIISYRPQATSTHHANITSHGEKTYNRPTGEVTYRFVVQGDRDGDDAGVYTDVEVNWTTLEVTLQQTEPEWLH